MAFMKETQHSMQLYFGLIGMISLVRILLALESLYVRDPDHSALFGNPGLLIGVSLGLLLALATLYIALAFRTLIVTQPNIIRGVIIAGMVLATLAFLGSLLRGFDPAGMVVLTIELLIGFYLLVNLQRLIREMKE